MEQITLSNLYHLGSVSAVAREMTAGIALIDSAQVQIPGSNPPSFRLRVAHERVEAAIQAYRNGDIGVVGSLLSDIEVITSNRTETPPTATY